MNRSDGGDKLESGLRLPNEIRTTVYRQKILIVDFADTTIPPGASSYGTETVYTLKKLFQHNRVVIEVITVPAALPICFFLCNIKHTGEYSHWLILSDNFPGINNK